MLRGIRHGDVGGNSRLEGLQVLRHDAQWRNESWIACVIWSTLAIHSGIPYAADTFVA